MLKIPNIPDTALLFAVWDFHKVRSSEEAMRLGRDLVSTIKLNRASAHYVAANYGEQRYRAISEATTVASCEQMLKASGFKKPASGFFVNPVQYQEVYWFLYTMGFQSVDIYRTLRDW